MSFEETIRQVLREELERIAALLNERMASLEKRLGGGARDLYLTSRRAADIAGVEPSTIGDWVKRGHLKRYGQGRLRVKASELEAHMERRNLQPADADSMQSKVDSLLTRLRR